MSKNIEISTAKKTIDLLNLYSSDIQGDQVAKEAGSTPRTIYRFLDIAYINPSIANKLLSGKQNINVNDLFKIARENQL